MKHSDYPSLDKVYIFTLWYYPSHFGIHVDDFVQSFQEQGIDVTIVTVEESVYRDRYFEPVRHMFLNDTHSPCPVIRLPVNEFINRQAFPPLLVLPADLDIDVQIRQETESKRVAFFHFFESLLPQYNRERFPACVGCSAFYAVDFVQRTLSQYQLPETLPDAVQMIVDAYLVHLYDSDGAIKGVDFLISETESLAHTLMQSKLKTPTYAVARPFDLELVMNSQPFDLRAQLGLAPNAHLLLYAGRPTKNGDALLPILREVRNRVSEPVYLILVGTQNYDITAWRYYSELKDVVIAIDFLPRAELFRYMRSSDVLVYPGLIDGQSKVVTESMAAELPVVAFIGQTTAITDIIEHDSSGVLVTANDTIRFAEEVCDLLRNPQRRARIVEGALARIREVFVERSFAQDYVCKINDIYARNSGNAVRSATTPVSNAYEEIRGVQ